MLPVHELMSRIRWDEKFGCGDFELGYLDHVEEKIIHVPFKRITFEQGNRFSFAFEDDEDEVRTIPFHRIREVRKNGVVIWSRPN